MRALRLSVYSLGLVVGFSFVGAVQATPAYPVQEFVVAVQPDTDLAYTYFVHGAMLPGSSTWEYWSFTRLEDSHFRANQPESFTVALSLGDGTGSYADPSGYDHTYGIIGIYSDTYDDITVSFDHNTGQSLVQTSSTFAEVFNGTNESIIAQAMRNEDTVTMVTAFADQTYLDLGEPGMLVNFCVANEGGTVVITEVPEPATIIFLSVPLPLILRYRRRLSALHT